MVSVVSVVFSPDLASKVREPNFLSEGVSCGLDKEIAPDGTYLKYFPFGAMIERSQMAPYHKKFKLEHSFNLRCYTLAIVTKLLIEYLEGC